MSHPAKSPSRLHARNSSHSIGNKAADILSPENLDRTCPYGHASTKHLSNSGSLKCEREADASSRARTLVLKEFVAFLKNEDTLPAPDRHSSFDEIAAAASAINPRAPSTIREVLPLKNDRSFEVVWRKFMANGGSLAAMLSFAHAEACKIHNHHANAAKSVMSALDHNLQERFRRSLTPQPNGPIAHGGIAEQSGRIYSDMSENDVLTLQRYQLLQERWLYRAEIDNLNEKLSSDSDLIDAILRVQTYLCRSLDRFIQKFPEYSDSKVAFGEIAVWDPDKACFIPSSRLVKVIIHNAGPWLFESPSKPANVRILDALNAARAFGAFEQFVCLFSKEKKNWRFGGIARKACPAKLALIQMFKIATEKGV